MAFTSIQAVMPLLIKSMEDQFNTSFNYTLHYNATKKTIGLNMIPKGRPATLYWLREDYTVESCFGKGRYGQGQKTLEEDLEVFIGKWITSWRDKKSD